MSIARQGYLEVTGKGTFKRPARGKLWPLRGNLRPLRGNLRPFMGWVKLHRGSEAPLRLKVLMDECTDSPYNLSDFVQLGATALLS